MIGRGADAIGCAHCTAMGGAVECRICGRVVCKACAADWTTCDQPSGRAVRLGITARLRDVDPAGRIGLVARYGVQLALVDLRQLRWIPDARLPHITTGGPLGARLTATHLVYPTYAPYANAGSSTVFRGLVVLSLSTWGSALVEGRRPSHGAAVSRGGGYYAYASDEETVEIYPTVHVPPPATATIAIADATEAGLGAPISFAPFPGNVVQSFSVDDAQDTVACATWGRIALYRPIASDTARVATADVVGDVRWIAAGGSSVASLVASGRSTVLEVRRLDERGGFAPEVYRHGYDRPIRAASLSRDGRFVALGRHDHAVDVHEVATGKRATFTEHTDTVGLVRFAGDDQLLVTADDDNRVVVRPRTASGYAPVAMPAKLGD